MLLIGSLVSTLQSRHRLALTERQDQIEEFQEIDFSVAKDMRERWKKMYNDWYADKNNLMPFAPTINGNIE